ncbi:hypothetical protein HAX54_052110, partial [Datura stramonium]|nr:hypothetical protein [Datura stramonium]
MDPKVRNAGETKKPTPQNSFLPVFGSLPPANRRPNAIRLVPPSQLTGDEQVDVPTSFEQSEILATEVGNTEVVPNTSFAPPLVTLGQQAKPWVKAEIKEAVRGLHNRLDSFELWLNKRLVDQPDMGSLREEIGHCKPAILSVPTILLFEDEPEEELHLGTFWAPKPTGGEKGNKRAVEVVYEEISRKKKRRERKEQKRATTACLQTHDENMPEQQERSRGARSSDTMPINLGV